MIKATENPLITPEMVKPSRAGYRVKGAFNPGAAAFEGEILLLLRVAEDCVPEQGCISVPYYSFDGKISHPEILKKRLDDPLLELQDSRGVVYDGIDFLSTMSHIRIGRSRDGIHFTIDDSPFIFPTESYESYGVEDCRVSEIDGTFYLTYTAVSQDGWATALATTVDFVNIEKKGIIFPPPNKDVSIFPEKINGKYCALHRPHNQGFGKPSIWYSESVDLLYWGQHSCLLRPEMNRWENQKIGGGPAPVKTEQGWLEIYHGKGDNDVYSLFVLLLDKDDPRKILKKGNKPLLTPEEIYEKEGFFPNIIFSNGLVKKADGEILLYYGSCDETSCVVRTSVDELLRLL